MEAYEEIIGHKPTEALGAWVKLCSDCRGTQERVLADILRRSADTEIGRRYGFAGIRSVEEYQQAVPVLDYPDVEDLVERMADGEEDLLFPGRTRYFISTSGTTGTSKKIPESAEGIEAKRAVLDLRNIFLAKGVLKACATLPRFYELLRKKGLEDKASDATWLSTQMLDHVHYFSVTSATKDRKTRGGIDIGFASGKTFENSPFTRSIAYPTEIMSLEGGDATKYLSMLFSLRFDDVTIVTTNNAGRFYSFLSYAQDHAEQMIADLRSGTIWTGLDITRGEREKIEALLKPCPERANELQAILDGGRDEFVPRNYWPYIGLAKFWLGGSVGVNVRKVRPMLSTDTVYFDVGYGASEAKINVPYAPNSVPGTLGIASAFYEFKPLDADVMLTADQLEAGAEYELFLTTYSGLYRYPLHDIVRVGSFFHGTPDVEFVTKSREIINISQEKLPASQVVDLLATYTRSRGVATRLAQVYPNLEETRYEVYLEPEDAGEVASLDLESFAQGFDAAMVDHFELYGRNREFGTLAPLAIRLMRDGWEDSLYAEKEGTGIPRSQVKLPVIALVRPDGKWVI